MEQVVRGILIDYKLNTFVFAALPHQSFVQDESEPASSEGIFKVKAYGSRCLSNLVRPNRIPPNSKTTQEMVVSQTPILFKAKAPQRESHHSLNDAIFDDGQGPSSTRSPCKLRVFLDGHVPRCATESSRQLGV